MSKSEALARRLADHGRHIYAYNHVYTNQVVYSLERSLNNNQALKQLAFAGKKTLPATLRKDMWRPLLSVSFPSPPQGLHAFRKLREYRRLHELHWASPKSADNKAPDKLTRSRLIMDQKANTVADLAQVLREQEDLGNKKLADLDNEQRRVREELLALASEAQAGALPVLEQSVQQQKDAIANMKRMKRKNDPQAPTRRAIDDATKAYKALRLKHQKMVAAHQVVDQAKTHAVSQSEAAEARGTASPDSVDLTIDLPPVLYQHDPNSKRQTKQSVDKAPRYTTDGVVVRWSNFLDAEYAASWPAAVRHEAAGLSRHTAVPVSDEPVFAAEHLTLRNASRKYQEMLASRDADPDADSADKMPSEFLGQPGETPQPAVRA